MRSSSRGRSKYRRCRESSLDSSSMGLVVVDPQVDVPVVVPAVAPARLDHQEGRRLLAPAVAARPLPGPKGFDHAFGECPGGLLEGGRHGGHDLVGGEDVPLACVAAAGARTRVLEALLTSERRRPARGVHDPCLSGLSLLVGRQEPFERGPGIEPCLQEPEAARPERDLGEGLRGHGADAAPGPRDHRAHRQELCDCVATPTSLASGSAATIENVMSTGSAGRGRRTSRPPRGWPR